MTNHLCGIQFIYSMELSLLSNVIRQHTDEFVRSCHIPQWWLGGNGSLWMVMNARPWFVMWQNL